MAAGDLAPPSASLPARPALQWLKRWGVDVQWPLGSVQDIIDGASRSAVCQAPR